MPGLPASAATAPMVIGGSPFDIKSTLTATLTGKPIPLIGGMP